MTARNSSHVMGATIIGGIAGAGLALLFAPRSGKETRQQLHENFDNIKNEASDKVSRVASVVRGTGKKAKAEMDELRDKSGRKSRRQSPVLSAWEDEV